MDIRAKVEARKAELRREQERLAIEERERSDRVREAARAKVQQRIAVLEPLQMSDAVAEPVAANEAPTDADIDRELDAALGKKAQAMWTSGENTTLIVLFLGGIASFFIFGWIIGLTLIVVSFIYLGRNNGKYKRQLRAELAKQEGAAA